MTDMGNKRVFSFSPSIQVEAVWKKPSSLLKGIDHSWEVATIKERMCIIHVCGNCDNDSDTGFCCGTSFFLSHFLPVR